jgi:hypothetical protein
MRCAIHARLHLAAEKTLRSVPKWVKTVHSVKIVRWVGLLIALAPLVPLLHGRPDLVQRF